MYDRSNILRPFFYVFPCFCRAREKQYYAATTRYVFIYFINDWRLKSRVNCHLSYFKGDALRAGEELDFSESGAGEQNPKLFKRLNAANRLILSVACLSFRLDLHSLEGFINRCYPTA